MCYYTIMATETNKGLDTEQAHAYLETIREHYLADHSDYRGTRNEEQSLIAELTSDEAQLLVDGVAAGVLALGGATMPDNYETSVSKADYKWEDFRREFERVLVGIGVISHRLNRDAYGVKSYADMNAHDRMQVASALFSDFLALNALRFGTDTAGLQKKKAVRFDTDDGGVETKIIVSEKDKAQTEAELVVNMNKRGYTSTNNGHPTTHTAGKMSPETYTRLRKAYPEMEKDKFDDMVGFVKDAENALANSV
mgnify:CR=1 FL=1